ncbi:MAG TPA: hypothetical protein VJ875_18470 [Pyrinomonadaceae bacterium]|nr:hypothetical protein [Pyrinomonadaceae bacterium]
MTHNRIPYGTKLPVHFTQAQLDDIREYTFAPEFAKHAIAEGKRLRVDLSLDDIEEIQGYVAAEANHTRNVQLRKRLDKLFLKFEKFLDTYDDQSDL